MTDTVAETKPCIEGQNLYTKRNFWCFALSAFGRDFAYGLFTGYLMSFMMFTKTLTDAQFSVVSIIIVIARIFDAFNDPIMGGIVVNTRTRFGRFRPWILTGGVGSALIIALLFSTPVDGWGFIALLAVTYLLFSVTFTMNDIPYYSLLPHLARNTHDRNKLSAAMSLVISAQSGVATVVIPLFTTSWSKYLGGSATSAYMWVSIISAFLFICSSLLIFFGIQDHTEVVKNAKDNAMALSSSNEEKLSFKDMFRVIKNNDQLLISAVIMILYTIGTGVIGGGLLTTYVYFEFGYNGMLTTVFGVFGGVAIVLFNLTFPSLMKKFGRTKIITVGGLALILGYAMIMFVGIFVPVGAPLFTVPILDMDVTLKYLLMAIPYGVVCLGQTCYYNMMFLNMSNTVEYNEWKTGKREEGLIFSLRPFTAKFSSALIQLVVMAVYLVVGVLDVTNGISDLDQQASDGLITNQEMLDGVNDLLNSVPQSKSIALVCCMCIIPIVFMIGAMILYKKKFILNDEKYEQIKKEIEERKLAMLSAETDMFSENALELNNAEEILPQVASSLDDTSGDE